MILQYSNDIFDTDTKSAKNMEICLSPGWRMTFDLYFRGAWMEDILNIISSETTRRVSTKLYLKFWGGKISLNGFDQLTKMVAIPIHSKKDKNSLKFFFTTIMCLGAVKLGMRSLPIFFQIMILSWSFTLLRNGQIYFPMHLREKLKSQF